MINNFEKGGAIFIFENNYNIEICDAYINFNLVILCTK